MRNTEPTKIRRVGSERMLVRIDADHALTLIAVGRSMVLAVPLRHVRCPDEPATAMELTVTPLNDRDAACLADVDRPWPLIGACRGNLRLPCDAQIVRHLSHQVISVALICY